MSSKARRGCGIAAIVIMLAAINLAVLGSVSASADEAKIGALRAETARAFYAAESGARVVLKCSNQGLTPPAASSTLVLGPATITYISLPAAGAAGDAMIKADDGTTTRRLKVTVSPS
jgi:Tfp pilus assembly protein PilX